jgi:type IV pilus assembly protein PilV
MSVLFVNDLGKRRRAERGFSLIEVLVSVFVLAFGVIGALGMQLTALKTARQSAFQSSALHLAAEMADHMRANVRFMQSAGSHNPYLQVDYDAGAPAPELALNCYSGGADCDGRQLAQFDIDEWLNRLKTALPGARVRICRDAAPWSTTEQNFSWTCPSAETGAAPIVIKIGWRDGDERSAHEEVTSSAPRIVLAVASVAQ